MNEKLQNNLYYAIGIVVFVVICVVAFVLFNRAPKVTPPVTTTDSQPVQVRDCGIDEVINDCVCQGRVDGNTCRQVKG